MLEETKGEEEGEAEERDAPDDVIEAKCERLFGYSVRSDANDDEDVVGGSAGRK